jgi:AcrR family transcriptional regulator
MATKRVALKKPVEESLAPPPKVTLRTLQKESTRLLIRETARAQFSSLGLAATQVDQIALAAGISRATFYLHFKDKEDVLRDIALDYTPRALAVMRGLKGPAPTKSDILAWLEEWVALVRAERAATMIFTELSQSDAGMPAYVQKIVEQIVEALAEKNVAFRAAVRAGPLQMEAKIRTEMLIMQGTKTCGRIARSGDRAYQDVALSVVAEMFEAFINNPRFAV